jgi:LacI family transcriptional regulator
MINHQTRRRVLDAADRLNYKPRQKNGAAEGQNGSERPNALGFLFFAASADLNQINPFYAPLLMGAQEEAGRLGMHLIVRTTLRDRRSGEMPQMWREQAVAGMLLVGAALPEVLADFDTDLPAVLVDNHDETGRHDCIVTGSFEGMRTATRHLLSLGHRQIAFVLDEPTAHSFQDRKRGYLCALWEAGITPQPEWIVTVQRGMDVAPYLAPLLDTLDRPTAIVAANDVNAFAVLAACRGLGLSIPEDMSVVGFDDISFSVHSYPPLTTMRVDKEQVGRIAVRRLLTRIEESRQQDIKLPTVHLVVPTTLVERQSCVPPVNSHTRTNTVPSRRIS